MTRIRSARRLSSIADSVFGELTRLAKLHNAVNLSQGFPDFEAPQSIKDAACAAIQAEQNQYAPPYGTKAFRDAIAERQGGWRRVVQTAIGFGIPVPAMAASLAYYDSYRSASLPANLLQAQRDYFGAHTYERVDKPGIFHTEWLAP